MNKAMQVKCDETNRLVLKFMEDVTRAAQSLNGLSQEHCVPGKIAVDPSVHVNVYQYLGTPGHYNTFDFTLAPQVNDAKVIIGWKVFKNTNEHRQDVVVDKK